MKALVLAGGGSKGSFQFGVIEALFERGYRPDLVVGTSVGALNAGGITYLGISGLRRVWDSISGKQDILSSNWWKLPWARGLYSLDPLRKHLNSIPETTVLEKIEAVACITEFSSGELAYVSSRGKRRPEFVEAVLASSAAPFIMEPIAETLLDGGVREVAPIQYAIDRGASEITAILCSPTGIGPEPWKPSWPYLASYGFRAVDLQSFEILKDDIEKCHNVYAPKVHLGPSYEFDPRVIQSQIAMGREAASV